jgi:hypothetical protein
MTEEKEQFMNTLLTQLTIMAEKKFRKGDAEHGSDLENKSILELNEEAMDECIDMMFYLLVQHKKIKQFKNTYGNSPGI